MAPECRPSLVIPTAETTLLGSLLEALQYILLLQAAKRVVSSTAVDSQHVEAEKL